MKKTLLYLLLCIGFLGYGQTTIDFDTSSYWSGGSSSSYNSKTYTDNSNGFEAYTNNGIQENVSGNRFFRLRNNSSAFITFKVTSGGVNTFSVQGKRWDNSPAMSYEMDYSTDNGSTWSTPEDISGILNSNGNYNTISGTINSTNSDIIIRLSATGNTERLYIDDFSWTAPAAGPTITTAGTVANMTYEAGSGPSTEESFEVSGVNLTADITVTAPTNFEVSTTSGSGFGSSITLNQSGGTVSGTNVYVRLKDNLGISTYNENIALTSTGADAVNLSITGEVILGNATAIAATTITTNSFTANWNAVSGATDYEIDVYEIVAGQNASDLFISEYIEGTSSNRYIEIFNGTGADVNLSNYTLDMYYAGSENYVEEILNGTLQNGEVKVYRSSGANIHPSTLSTVSTSACNFTGDESIGLYNSDLGDYVDIFGAIDTDPGNGWSVNGNYTQNKTLRRNSDVYSGNNDDATGFPSLGTEWTEYTENNVDDLGQHTFDGGDSTNYIIQNQSTGNTTSYTVTGLNPNSTYYYVVRAVAGANESANSNIITANTAQKITWESAAWSNTTGPTATDDVLIKDDLTISADLAGLTMEIESGSTVTVSNGNNLTIANAILNNGAIVIENNANLIQTSSTANTGTGTYKVKRNSNALKRLDYTLWSSPVVNQNLLAFSPNTVESRFYTYNATTDLFNSITPSTTAFDTGKGYLIRMPNNHPTTATLWNGEFNGSTVNNGDVSVAVTDAAYNSVGNPYPSAIDADAFITNNSITEPLYFWRKDNNATTTATNSYATYTTAGGVANTGDSNALQPNGTINVGQGFITKATSANLMFNNGMRIANNNNQFFRTQNNTEHNRIWLNLTADSGASYQTMVAYMTGASEEVDPAIDGKPFQVAAVSLTSLINDESYVIQGRALPFDDNDVVTMRFTTNQPGVFTISKVNQDGLFANGQEVYLKDNTLGIEHLLDTPYTFASETGTFDNRFEIVYRNTLNASDFNTNESMIAFINASNELSINTQKTITEIQLFDVTGRLLLSKKEINSTSFVTPSIWNNSIGILKVTTINGETISKKIKL